MLNVGCEHDWYPANKLEGVIIFVFLGYYFNIIYFQTNFKMVFKNIAEAKSSDANDLKKVIVKAKVTQLVNDDAVVISVIVIIIFHCV